MQGLDNKIILLTGANGGLGRAIAGRLAQAGCRLILAEKTPELAQEARESLTAETTASTANTISGDLSQPQEVEELIHAAHKIYGALDGIVNNAAMLDAGDAGIADTSVESFDTTIAHNLKSVFLTCRAIMPLFHQQGHGVIVNISSIVAHAASANAQIAYTTAKGGIEAMTREIAIEQARHNIRANCVAPGPILTDRTAHYFDTEEKWASRRQHIPMGRLGRPSEIAGAVCFLLSDDSGYMTGSTLLADGGIANAYVVKDENGAAKP